MDDPETGASPAARRNDESREFGERIRHLRERAGMSLQDLSGRSGVSRAMLSKVERGEKSPTIGIAKRIAHALGASLSFLTGAEAGQRATMLVRKAERPVFRDPETGFERHILSPTFAGGTTELVLHRLPAGASTGPLPAYPSGTEKYVIALEGEVVVTAGVAEFTLNEGDAFFFEADVEHAFANRTARVASYYLFISRRVQP